MKTALLFVYNAKSDRLNVLLDFAHKIVSPSTYACDLCKLTHSTLGEHKAWTTFTEASKIPFTFYHIDEFEQSYTETYIYPVILKNEGSVISVLLDAEAIASFKTTEELIVEIEALL